MNESPAADRFFNKGHVRLCIFVMLLFLAGVYAYLIISLPYRAFPQTVLQKLRDIPFIQKEIGRDAFWWFNLSVTKKGDSLLLINGDLTGESGTGDVAVKVKREEAGRDDLIISAFLFKGEKCFLFREGREFSCATKRVKRRGRREKSFLLL